MNRYWAGMASRQAQCYTYWAEVTYDYNCAGAPAAAVAGPGAAGSQCLLPGPHKPGDLPTCPPATFSSGNFPAAPASPLVMCLVCREEGQTMIVIDAFHSSSEQCQCKIGSLLLRFSERGSNRSSLLPGGGGQLTF